MAGTGLRLPGSPRWANSATGRASMCSIQSCSAASPIARIGPRSRLLRRRPFCRMLKASGITAIGIDPTRALVEEARRRDAAGDYGLGNAESLPFEAGSFDLVVSYLTLIDIADSGRQFARWTTC